MTLLANSSGASCGTQCDAAGIGLERRTGNLARQPKPIF